MAKPLWGVLARDHAGITRRTRGLGLGAAVRIFNELAVPGLGGIWFARPLAWAILGIKLAREHDLSSIEVANAIEALACWHGRAERDPRVRGRRKMGGVGSRFVAFSEASRPGFYVTQPFRQATVIPLPAFGLVKSESHRFSAFELTDEGESLLQHAFGKFRPNNRSVEAELSRWIDGEQGIHTDPMRKALSPREDLPLTAREFLRERLECHGEGALRRTAVLRWLRTLNSEKAPGWKTRPAGIDHSHWGHLRAGGSFFRLRDAALEALDGAEYEVRVGGKLGLEAVDRDPIRRLMSALNVRAQNFLKECPAPFGAKEAESFAHELVNAQPSDALRCLVNRDQRRLVMRGDIVIPGLDFPRNAPVLNNGNEDASEGEEGPEAPINRLLRLPEGISGRVRALHLLDLDLAGKLNSWFNGPGASP